MRQLQGWRRKTLIGLLTLFCIFPAISGCSSDKSRYLSFLDPQGPYTAAERTHFLEVVAVLGIFVALPIFVLTPWLAWRYRYGARSPRYTPKWRDSLPLAIMTWAGPIVIVIALGYLVWSSAHLLDPYKPIASNTNTSALHVQVIGYDWKWLFIYPELGIASVGVMSIPIGRPVAMKLTSATVMQSLQIPALVGQIYVMGGMVTQLHFEATHPGRSLGQNTMYNGDGFYKEKFTAIAMTSDGFKAWVRKVRTIGVPMNAHTYKALSQRSTRAQLVAALPQVQAHDGNVYLTGVSAALFPAVVKATMNGTPVTFSHGSVALTETPATVPQKATAL